MAIMNSVMRLACTAIPACYLLQAPPEKSVPCRWNAYTDGFDFNGDDDVWVRLSV